MAENQRVIDATPQTVWAVLCDGSVYADWVVGTSTIRAVDPTWPAKGSKLHYSIGRGPLRHDGHTEVIDSDEGSRLVLEAHAWPLGTARIDLRLADEAGRTKVTMLEAPARGAAARVHNPAGDLLLKVRNVESLRRLARLAVQRQLTRPAVQR